MGEITPFGTRDPRRHFGRMKLGIPALLETLYGRKHVRMVDLSQGGASVILPQEIQMRECIARWLDFEVFCSRVWQDGTLVGLTFERPLPLSTLLATRKLAPELIRDEELDVHRAAQSWTAGWIN